MNRHLLTVSWMGAVAFAAFGGLAHAAAKDTAPAPVAIEPERIDLELDAAEVRQGGIVRAVARDPRGIATIEARFGDRAVRFVPGDDGARLALVGVDLDAAVGPHVLRAKGTLTDGTPFSGSRAVDVRESDYPVQQLTVDSKYQEFDKATLARIQRENARLGKIWRTASPEIFWRAPFVLPIAGQWGGGFGARRVFNGVPKRPHSGVDVPVPAGTPFGAANRGRVVLAEDLYFSGNSVIIDHGGSLFTMYFHLSKFACEVGDVVDKGAVIGYVGATGRVTGPHLHWGVKLNQARVDPRILVRTTGGADTAITAQGH